MTTQLDNVRQERNPLDRAMRIVARLVGAVFLLFGLGMLIRELRFAGTAEAAFGTITDVRVEQSTDGPIFSPVVEFQTREGRRVRFVGTATSPAPVAGTTVAVLYHPAKPEEARINTFVQRWLFPTILIPTGLLLVFLLRPLGIRREAHQTKPGGSSASVLVTAVLLVASGCDQQSPASDTYRLEWQPAQLRSGSTNQIEVTVQYALPSSVATPRTVSYNAQVVAPHGWSVAPAQWAFSYPLKSPNAGFRETRKLVVTVPEGTPRGQQMMQLHLAPAAGAARTLDLPLQVVERGK